MAQFPNLLSQFPTLNDTVAPPMPANMSGYALAVRTQGGARVVPATDLLPVLVLWGKRRGVAMMLSGAPTFE